MSNFAEMNGPGVDEPMLPRLRGGDPAARIPTYTLAAADMGKRIGVGTDSAGAVTIPTNAQVPMPIGSTFVIERNGTAKVTIAGASGVAINVLPLPDDAPQYRQGWTVVLRKVATDTWTRLGDLTIG